MTGTQMITNVSDMARFGRILFRILSPLQLAVITFVAALATASAVAQEKDRKTIILMLLTRLTNSELVLGKLFSSLLQVISMLVAGLPVFGLIVLFGGVSFGQVIRVFLVTLVTAVAAGSLGSTMALWREKTFQTLAMTALTLVFWVLGCEAIGAGIFGPSLGTISTETLATWLSPLRAIIQTAQSDIAIGEVSVVRADLIHCCFAATVALLVNLLAIARVRIWNPSREVRRVDRTVAAGSKDQSAISAEAARDQHVDSQLRQTTAKPYRSVWLNPVLWREVCTWAYGRKILVIRLIYLLFAAAMIASIWYLDANSNTFESGSVLPVAVRPLVPLFVVSLVIVNALSVTTITTERDGRSLDLLLVTDISPPEFLFGKIGGAIWVTKEMVVLPFVASGVLWYLGRINLEGLLFLCGGLVVMNLFVAMLGVHCGMNYASSRAAIGVSLGTVFFLFLGITTCILMMISFSGSFSLQLYPFLAFIIGGGVGLFVSLGSRNPSGAILTASLALPFATFYAIVSYFLELPLYVFLVTCIAYGFTTAAMMIPALSEFNFAMGRTGEQEE